MKDSIIEEIFYIKRENNEIKFESEEYLKMYDELIEKHKKFSEKLSDEMKDEFEDICSLQADLEEEMSLTQFKEGYKIGIKLGLEVVEK